MDKNPYEVLGVNKNATEDEIRRAYRELVKKYHPDKYLNNPLKDLAEEKMREVNSAYNEIMSKTKKEQERSYYKRKPKAESEDFSPIFKKVRDFIREGNYLKAEETLKSVPSKNAEWNYLMGIIHFKRGLYDSSYSYLTRACAMDPSNEEYRNSLRNIFRNNSNYSNCYGYRRREWDCDLINCCNDTFCNGCECGFR